MNWKTYTHFLFGAVALGIGWLAWIAFDMTPPSFVIALWAAPYEVFRGQEFVVTEIFVRNKFCMRFISQGFRQNGTTHIPTDNPLALLLPRRYGLQTYKYSTTTPQTLEPGPAEYRMTITWICPFYPWTWFGGAYYMGMTPMRILNDVDRDCTPKETTIQVPGAQVQIRCKSSER